MSDTEKSELIEALKNAKLKDFINWDKLKGISNIYCSRCYRESYVEQNEMDFIIENEYYLYDRVQTSTPWYDFETFILVTQFCPKCNYSVFREISQWRRDYDYARDCQ